MPDERAARLLDEAATAGLRITDLDGWSQTRLAGSLHLRREVVNAIINRGPAAEPSDARPKMVEACRKIIAFAAVISRKDDAVVPREVEALHRLDDDAQAYETHKMRLRRVVEDAAAGGAFIEAMYRVGELSSHAVNAPPRFRVKMIGNVVTAIQRLLDKPESRSVPLDLLGHNLRRLTLAEWAARRAVRSIAVADERAKAADDLHYIRGQVGYAMIFNGLLARSGRAIRRGRRRLWRAVRVQPSPDCGHWSNLLRATNDLLANGHRPARKWALSAVTVAERQRQPGFAQAFGRLRDNGEIKTLIGFWEQKEVMARVRAVLSRPGSDKPADQAAPVRPRRANGTTAAAVLLAIGLLTFPSAARAGDGKELARKYDAPRRVSISPPARMPLIVRRGADAGVASRDPGASNNGGANDDGAEVAAESDAAATPRGTRGRTIGSRPTSASAYPPRPQRNAYARVMDVETKPEPGPAAAADDEPVSAARERAGRQRSSASPGLLLALARARETQEARAWREARNSSRSEDAESIPLRVRIDAESAAVTEPAPAPSATRRTRQ